MRMVLVSFVAGLAIAAAGCSKGDGNPRLVNPPDPKLKPVKPSMGGGGPPAEPAKDKEQPKAN